MNLEEIVKTIDEEFENGHMKQIASKEMIRRLEEKGFEREDIDDALDEAERRKIVNHCSGFYIWIDTNLREAEKAKTQKHNQILAEIFKEGQIDFLPEEDVKIALMKRGFKDEQIHSILIEAERDHVLDFYTRGLGSDYYLVAGCSWIPPEERQNEVEAEKRERKWQIKWHEEKAMQDDSTHI